MGCSRVCSLARALCAGGWGCCTEVGNFFSPYGDAEGRSNFALWCLMKAPLILGTDLTNLTVPTLATITNRAAIAVNKDSLGEQGLLRTSAWSPGGRKPDPEGHPPHGYQVRPSVRPPARPSLSVCLLAQHAMRNEVSCVRISRWHAHRSSNGGGGGGGGMLAESVRVVCCRSGRAHSAAAGRWRRC
jgi:hypothetical protein